MKIDYSHPLMLAARRIGQNLGILRPMVRFYRKLLSKNYEEKFDHEMMSNIRPGDVVWDVGANVGIYTLQFAIKCGALGKVIAFEPAPLAAKEVILACIGFDTVQVMPLALSDFEGQSSFSVQEALGVTNSLRELNEGVGSENTISVRVATGDALIKSGEATTPNVVKLDVEGFEWDVLRGLTETLVDRHLRAVFVEVHFLELSKRNLSSAPNEISSLLKRAGFAVSWCDPSHIVAIR